MDFGFGRFLEMFEERFGRTATTVLLAALGLAAATWSVKTVIEFAVYIYDLPIKAHLLTGLQTESIFAHAIFFGVQFAITLVVAAYLFKRFVGYRIVALKAWATQEMQEIEQRWNPIKEKAEAARLMTELLKDAMEKSTTAMATIKDEIQKKVDFIKSKEAEDKKQEPPEPPSP